MTSRFRADDWLTGLLGKPAHHLIDVGDPLPPLPQGDVFVDAKIGIDDLRAFRSLLDAGFDLVSVDVKMRRPPLPSPTAADPAVSVRPAIASDREAVCRVAEGAFTTDRFHADPEIPDKTADRLKAAWVGNFFSGQRGTHLHVAESEGGIVGFLLTVRSDAMQVVDLIGVSEGARGAGVGRAMMARLSPELPVETGTQLANVKAVNFYEKMGFAVCGATCALHYHGAPQGRPVGPERN